MCSGLLKLDPKDARQGDGVVDCSSAAKPQHAMGSHRECSLTTSLSGVDSTPVKVVDSALARIAIFTTLQPIFIFPFLIVPPAPVRVLLISGSPIYQSPIFKSLNPACHLSCTPRPKTFQQRSAIMDTEKLKRMQQSVRIGM